MSEQESENYEVIEFDEEIDFDENFEFEDDWDSEPVLEDDEDDN